MSHTVKCVMEMKDVNVIEAAANALGFPVDLAIKRRKLYGSNYGTGVAVSLPDWNYPVIINPETGETVYDNYKGSWGDITHLDALTQRYSIEAATQEAESRGMLVNEEVHENGDVALEFVQMW